MDDENTGAGLLRLARALGVHECEFSLAQTGRPCSARLAMTYGRLMAAAATTLVASARVLMDETAGRLTPERADEHVGRWAAALLDQVNLGFDVHGLDRIPAGEAFVVMSNHQSLYDIPVLCRALPLRVRMVTKAELFRFPLWGSAMRNLGFIELDRGDRAQALQGLRRAQEALAIGTSIWIAPEGTRSSDGKLLPFKPGGFHLACAAKVRILPVTIDGTRRALPNKSLQATRGVRVRVTVGEPVDTRAFKRKDRDELAERVRAAIERHLSAP